MRTIRRSPYRRDADALDGIPAELHGPLLALARAQVAVDDARREVTLASVHTKLRWHELDAIVHKLRLSGV
jgi:hypothetical protein